MKSKADRTAAIIENIDALRNEHRLMLESLNGVVVALLSISKRIDEDKPNLNQNNLMRLSNTISELAQISDEYTATDVFLQELQFEVSEMLHH